MKKVIENLEKKCNFLYFLAMVSPLFGLVIISFWLILILQVSSAKKEGALLAKVISKNSGMVFYETQGISNYLADSYLSLKNNKETCNDSLANILKQRKHYSGITIVDAQGEIICNGNFIQNSPNVYYRPYFQKMLEEKNFVVGDYISGAVTGKDVLPFAKPVFNSSGEIIGAVIIFYDLSFLNENNEDVLTKGNDYILTIDSDGKLLGCYPESDCIGKDISRTDLFKEIINKGTGSIRSLGIHNKTKYFSFTPVEVVGTSGKMYIAVGRSEDEIIREVIKFTAPLAVYLLAACFLACRLIMLKRKEKGLGK